MALAAGRGGAGKDGSGGGSKEGRGGEGGDDPRGLMPPAELRAALKRAGRKPASCVIGLTKDRQAVILLDRLKKPRKLLGEAKAQAKAAGLDLDLASLRFGRVSVDGGSAQAGFTVNKPVPPAAQQAMKAPMRAAGHPRFTVNADPSLEDEPDGPDEADDADEAGDRHPPTPAGDNAAPAGRAGAPSLPGAAIGQPVELGGPPGAAMLEARLTPLVKRVAAAVASSQPGADGLRAAAVAAGSALRSGDLAAAGRGTDALERLLSDPAVGAPPGAATLALGNGTGQTALPSADALTSELTGLVQRLGPAIAADPSRKEPLLKLANDANTRLKAGDAQGAAGGIKALHQALPLAGVLGAGQATGLGARQPLAGPFAAGSGDPLLMSVSSRVDQQGRPKPRPRRQRTGEGAHSAAAPAHPPAAAPPPEWREFHAPVPKDCRTLEDMFRLFEREAFGREMNLTWDVHGQTDMAAYRGKEVPFDVPLSMLDAAHGGTAGADVTLPDVTVTAPRPPPDTMEQATARTWEGVDERSIAGMSESDRLVLAKSKAADLAKAQLRFMADHPGATAADFGKSMLLLNTPEVLAAARKDIADATKGDRNAWDRIGSAAGGAEKVSGWLLAVVGVAYVVSWAFGVGELVTLAAAAEALLVTTVGLSVVEGEAKLKAASQSADPADFKRNTEAAAGAAVNVTMAMAMVGMAKVLSITAKVPFGKALEDAKAALSDLQKRIAKGEPLDAVRAEALERMAGPEAALADALARAKKLAADEAALIEKMSNDAFVAHMDKGGGVPDGARSPAGQKIDFGRLRASPGGEAAVEAFKKKLVDTLRTTVTAGLESRFRSYIAEVDGFIKEAGAAKSVEELAAATAKLQEFLGERHMQQFLREEQGGMVQRTLEDATGRDRESLQRTALREKLAAEKVAVGPDGYTSTNPPINIRHIGGGDINGKGKAGGFHDRPAGADPAGSRMTRMVEKPDRNGVYTGRVEVKNPSTGAWVAKKAASSFFPDTLSEQQIVNGVLNALKDSGLTGDGQFRGKSGLGFVIEGWYRGGKIESAYPVRGR